MSRVLALLLVVGCLALALMHRAAGDADEKAAPPQRKDSLGDPLPPAALARFGSLRLVHGGPVTSLIFSKDDRTLISLGGGTVRTWGPADGKERGSAALGTDREPNLPLAVSPDARFVACVSADAHITVRDLLTGKSLHRFATPKGISSQVAFGPEGRSLVWVAADGVINLTDLAGERKTRELKGTQQSQVRSPALSADGKLLAALVDNDRAVLWDAASGKRTRQYTAGQQGARFGLTGLCLDPEGKLLFAATDQGGVVAWETDSIEERYSLEAAPGGVAALHLSPDGKTLAVSLATGGIKLYQARTGKALQTLEGEPAAGAIAFSRDGKTVAIAGQDGRIRLWDVATARRKEVAKQEAVLGAVFGKNGREVVTATAGQITHWTVAGKAARQVKLGDDVKGRPMLSPCGRYALMWPAEGEARLIDTEKGEARKDFTARAENGDVAAFHPAGRYVAVVAGQEANVVHLYSPLTGKKTGQLQLAEQPLATQGVLAFSPDGRTLYTAHPLDGWLNRWELATGKTRQPFRFPAGLRPSGGGVAALLRMEALAFRKGAAPLPAPPAVGGLDAEVDPVAAMVDFTVSPDGRFVAVLNGERVCLCDVIQGKLARSLDGSEAALEAMGFSPDGKYLAASGGDQKVRLWEVATGKLVVTLGGGHRGTVHAVTFAPDGKRFLTVGSDGVAVLWSVAEALRLPVPQPPKRAARTAEALWAEMASDDGAAAELAVRDLAAVPDAALPLLARQLKAVGVVERARLDRLVEQLDSEEKRLRDEASRELIGLDDQARPAVEAAMKSESAEVRKRAGAILERLDRLSRPGAEVRPFRAVEVLELIGTPAARKLLTELSGGAPEARLTRDAAAALARLQGRDS